jgi:hypothetical protein
MNNSRTELAQNGLARVQNLNEHSRRMIAFGLVLWLLSSPFPADCSRRAHPADREARFARSLARTSRPEINESS